MYGFLGGRYSIGQEGYKRYRGDSAIKHYFLVANVFFKNTI